MMRSTALNRTRGRLLSCGVATAALLGAVDVAQAQSLGNDACGPLVDGRVTCAPGQYPDGIHYGGETQEDITVRLEDGTVVEADIGRPALHVLTEGSISVEGAGSALTSRNASGVAAYVADTGAGDISLILGDVTAISDNTGTTLRGVDAYTAVGDTIIDVGNVRTSGDFAIGVRAESVVGDISIRAQSVETDGWLSDGIFATTGGAITIDAGRVTTSGDEARGIVALGGLGPISIFADTIETGGFASDGIVVAGAGDISVSANEIRGTGEYIWGVNAQNGFIDDFGQIYSGTTTVSVGTIDLTGANNAGVILTAYGDAAVQIGDLVVNGDFGVGTAIASQRNATLSVRTATFTGQDSGGLGVEGLNASISVDTLTSESGGGAYAQALGGLASIRAGTVDVGGQFVLGVGAGSIGGDVSIVAGNVTTRGYGSKAISGQAFLGAVRIEAGSVTTLGDNARAVDAYGKTVVINIRGPIETSGSGSEGVLAATTFGDAQVTTTGSVTTRGDFAAGVWAVGRYGMAEVRATGAIMTSGVESHGIRVAGESGEARVFADRIVTSGDSADGIHARTRFVDIYAGQPDVAVPPPFTGDIEVRASEVSVTGAGAIGVSARGLRDARLLLGNVSSRQDLAIEADMIRNVSLDLRGTARSERGTAVSLKGEALDVTLGAFGRIEGAVDGLVLQAGARCLLPDPADGRTPNPCPNPDDDYNFPGRPVLQQPILDGGVATVTNAGAIVGGSGHAIRQTHGRLALTNTGQILGSLSLAGGNDRLDNAGLFSFSKDSDFGAGTDILRNTGVVALDAATSPVTAALRNLERFENAGLIDLRNGAIGDRLSISGDFVGLAGSTVALEVDLAKGLADRIIIGGAATGSTALTFKSDASSATLGGLDGLIVVETGLGSSAAAFTMADGGGDLGFVGHSLDYDAATRRYSLQSAASAGAYRQLGLLQALDGVWTASAEAVSAQAARSRDAAFAGSPAGGFWFTLHGGETSREWDAAMTGGGETDLSYDQTRQGGQFGYDRVLGRITAGVTAGYSRSTLEFESSTDEFEVSSFNLGAYAGTTWGAAFANALLKYDRHSAEISSTALTGEVDLDGSTWGIDLEAGYRFGDSSLFVEPLAAIRWSTGSFDDLVSGAQTLAFADSEDVTARLGFRIGGASTLSGGDRLSIYGGASLVHSLGDDYRITLISGARQDVEADRVETWGQGVVGVSYKTARGLETFAEGQGDVGSGYDGLSARIGMRVRF